MKPGHCWKATAAILFVASAHAQQTRLVTINPVVTGRKGVYVRDLTRKDFRIWEDGKEQTISSFSSPASQVSTGDRKRYFVIFFDDATIAPENRRGVREAAAKFIDSNTGPDRLISLIEFGASLRVVQDFTADVARLKQALSEVTLSGLAQGGNSIYETAALREMAAGLGANGERKAVIFLSGGFSANSADLSSVADAFNRSDAAVYPVNLGGRNAGGAFNPGDLASGGGLNSGIDAAGIDTPGLGPAPSGIPGPGRSPGAESDAANTRSSADALSALAAATGGFVSSHPGDLPGALGKIGQEQNEYYTLGFIPSKEPKPGACHTIKVKVDRGGTSERSRSGYCESANGTPLAQANPQVSGLRPSIMAPFFYTSPHTARVDAAIDIPGAIFQFTNRKGRLESSLNVTGAAYLPDGGVAARFADSVEVTLDNRTQADEFASKTYHYEKQFEIAPGKFNLKVTFNSGPNGSGYVETALTVYEWDPSKFFLSGLALSNSVRPAASGAQAAGPAPDKVPLLAAGMEITPAGSNRFHKTDRVFIYGEVYEPASASAGKNDDQGLRLHMVLQDAKTRTVVKDLGETPLKALETPGKATVPIGMIVPVADLPPGSYVAQLTALDSKGDEIARAVAFDLEP